MARSASLPASQKVKYQQFEVSASPAWWLRRRTRFPLFFQTFHPTFEFIIKKVSKPQPNSDDQPESSNLNFYVEFSDGSKIDFSVDVSSLNVGDTIRQKTQRILLAPTGDARVCLDMGPNMTGGRRFHTLYAFVVSAEATLVFLLLNVILGTILALLLRL